MCEPSSLHVTTPCHIKCYPLSLQSQAQTQTQSQESVNTVTKRLNDGRCYLMQLVSDSLNGYPKGEWLAIVRAKSKKLQVGDAM